MLLSFVYVRFEPVPRIPLMPHAISCSIISGLSTVPIALFGFKTSSNSVVCCPYFHIKSQRYRSETLPSSIIFEMQVGFLWLLYFPHGTHKAGHELVSPRSLRKSR